MIMFIFTAQLVIFCGLRTLDNIEHHGGQAEF